MYPINSKEDLVSYFITGGKSKKNIKTMIKNRISIYNHEVDKSQNKFDGTIKLHKLSNKYLPKYIVKNFFKYKAWFN